MSSERILTIILLLAVLCVGNEGILFDIVHHAWDQFVFCLHYLGLSLRGIDVQLARIDDLKPTYDFIIVGAGSAGSVLASRLTEENFTVLLLDAGKTENAFSQVPYFAPFLQLTDYNWQYLTEPQDNFCKAMIDGKCAFPRGRALGGSSVINYMIYTRGSRQDYDSWAVDVGDATWNYDNVLKYFKKSEKVMLEGYNYDEKYHGTEGPWEITTSYTNELTDAFLSAAEYLGYQTGDYNGEQVTRFSRAQTNQRKGRRLSVAKAFLEKESRREILDIKLGAFVTRLLVNHSESETLEVTGVEFFHHGHYYEIQATKEVILSAGTFNTPKLLMLAGVGPQQHLENLGIKVIKDLPVGEHLQDHISYIGLSFLTNKTIYDPVLNVFDYNMVREWYQEGTGLLTSLGGVEAIGYIHTQNETEIEKERPEIETNLIEINVNSKTNQTAKSVKSLSGLRNPDVELIFVGSGTLATDYGLFNRRLQRITDEFYQEFFAPNEGQPGWTVFPMLLHPKSEGRITLASRNPFDAPLFHPNYYAHKSDRTQMIEAIKFIIRMSKTPAFQQYGSRLSPVTIRQCRKYLQSSKTTPTTKVEKETEAEPTLGPLEEISINVNTKKDTEPKLGPLEEISINVNPKKQSRPSRNINIGASGSIRWQFGWSIPEEKAKEEENYFKGDFEEQDAYWDCALEYLSVTLHHQLGTCRMSPQDDTSGVVNPDLMVKGFRNLRVADASIIPRPLTAHTNAPAVMIGEKAADIIKQVHRPT